MATLISGSNARSGRISVKTPPKRVKPIPIPVPIVIIIYILAQAYGIVRHHDTQTIADMITIAFSSSSGQENIPEQQAMTHHSGCKMCICILEFDDWTPCCAPMPK
jgi:hypothetical protein